MSFLDKIAAALTPPESEEDRAEARAKVRALAPGNNWLGEIIRHHEMIEGGFETARTAASPDEARRSVRELAGVLNGQALAEEVVLYPVLVMDGHKTNATEAYEEHQMTKVQMAELETIPPLTQEWQDKLEHIHGAVLHHIYREESSWLPKLVDEASTADRVMLETRFIEEYERYSVRA